MPTQTILLAGASRGLGLGLAREYLGRGWQVIATARSPDRAAGLAELKQSHPDRFTIETLDILDEGSVAALAGRLKGGTLDTLFVVAGVSGHTQQPIQDVSADEAAHEFLTNAIGPLKLAEALIPSLAPQAAIVFMTSILGSIGSNAGGSYELYRATKSALNMLASCFALRHREHAVVLMHPGWVRTDMGGASAPLDVETSARGMADTLDKQHGRAGVAYLDYQGTKLPW